MRPTVLLLATTASCASVTKLGCPLHLFEELVTKTSCGDNKYISKCLQSDINLGRLDEIEQCYIAGGCSKADATIGAVWFAHEYRQEVREEDERQHLNRRADSTDTDSATETTEKTTAKTTAKTAAKTTEEITEKTTEKTTEKSTAAKTTESAAASSTAAPSSAAASTTSDSTTSDSTTTSSTSASTASSTTSSSSTTTSSGSSTSGKVTTTGTLLCSSTNTVQTKECFVTSGTTASCVSTTALVATCAAGNLCMTNTAGEDTCMKIDNTVSPGGIAVAIVFGSAITAVLVGILVMNHKANSAAKRQQAQQDAFLADYKGKGRTADVEAFRGGPQTSEANLPLIQEPGQHGYGGQEYLDHGRRAPQLHQGLGSLS